MPVIPRKLHTKYEVNRTQEKELFRYYGCHGNLVTVAMRYMVNAYHTKKASYQISPQ